MEWIDTVSQGDPETVVSLPNGETLIGLHIRGVEGYPMLPIRVDIIGRPVSVGRDNVISLNTTADVPLQSNPRRIADRGEDGA